MKKLAAVLVVIALAGATAAFAEEWTNVALIDHHCLSKFKADPDAHPTSCLIQCAKSGYGIITADGKWLKFDKAGNEKALEALKATDKKDHIRVNVTGEVKNGVLEVTQLSIP
jgi:VCBS repeat-containing protein